MDNKHWLFRWYDQSVELYWMILSWALTAEAVNGYERALSPLYGEGCVILDERLGCTTGSNTYTLNTAVEASTLTERVGGVMCCCAPVARYSRTMRTSGTQLTGRYTGRFRGGQRRCLPFYFHTFHVADDVDRGFSVVYTHRFCTSCTSSRATCVS